MSLLNSKVFSNIFGKAGQFCANVMDHVSDQSIFKMVRDCISRVKMASASKHELIAALTMDDRIYCDSLVETGVVSRFLHDEQTGDGLAVDLSSFPSLCTAFMQLPAGFFQYHMTGSLTIPVQIRDYELGPSFVIYKVTSGHVVEIPIGGFRINSNSLVTPHKVITVPSEVVTGLEDSDEGSTINVNPLLIMFQAVSLQSANFVKEKYISLFSPLCTAFGHITNDQGSEDFAGSLLNFIKQNSEFNSETGLYYSSFTDQLGKGYCIATNILADGSFYALWNNDEDTPFVIFNAEESDLKVSNIVYDIERSPSDLSTFARNCLISEQMNGFLVQAGEQCFSTNLTVEQFVSSMSVYVQGCSTDVQSMLKTATQAVDRGGVLGLAYYLLGFFTSTRSADVDQEDQVMVFTDSATWVPKDYVAGIINAIGSALQTIALAVAAIFSKVFGAIISFFSLIFQFIGNLTAASWETTMFKLSDSPLALEWSTPYSLFQTSVPITDDTASDILNYVKEYKVVAYVTVPGGYLFIGPTAYVDGVPSAAGVEFHPDVVDRRHYFGRFSNFIWGLDTSVSPWLYPFTKEEVVAVRSCFSPSVASAINTRLELHIDFLLSPAELKTLSKIFSWWVNFSEEWIQEFPGGMPAHNASGHMDDNGKIPGIVNCNMWFYLLMSANSINETFPFFPRNAEGSYSMVISMLSASDSTCSVSFGNVTGSNTDLGRLLMYTFFGNNRYGPSIDPSFQRVNWIQKMLDLNELHPSTWMTANMVPVMNMETSSPDSLLTSSGFASVINSDIQPNFFGYQSSAADAIEALDSGQFYGTVKDMPSKYEFFLKTPAYTASSLWSAYILGSLVAVASIALTTFVAIKANRAIKQWNAKRSAQVEAAWSKLTDDPTAENAKAYYKIAKRNNFISSVFGGSKYSTTNFWGDSDSSSGVVSDAVSAIRGSISETENDANVANSTDRATTSNFSLIYSLITGKAYSNTSEG